ncbi:MAG: hypothetical protein QG641_2044, partial [Candidatus Poribacteria bacterium]|nr:hypothetical protein [Candidatus Poribacteria bacterium]
MKFSLMFLMVIVIGLPTDERIMNNMSDEKFPFQDPSLSIETRVNDLVSR